ncbi:MAG TPA: type IV secretory system conjugative DNA transfer family protein [Gaiellaceae bacterium]
MPLERLVSCFRPQPPFVWREVHWPAELPLETAVAFLRQLATDRFVPSVAFELQANAGRVVYRIGVHAEAAHRVEHLLPALLPRSALTIAPQRSPLARAWHISLSTRHRPLETKQAEAVARAVLAASVATRSGETLVIQWLLGSARPPRPVSAGTPAAAVQPWWQPLLGSSSVEIDGEQRRALEAKRGDHAFACIGRIAVNAATDGRASALAAGVLASLRVAESPGIGVKLLRDAPQRLHAASAPWRWPLVLNVAELPGLLGWPLGDQPLPGLPRDESRWLRPDPRIKPHGRALGEAAAPGEDRRLGLSIADSRQHLHVIGPTGTGKSTLMANLICQDIAAGRGVVVVEPKGDLVQEVLARVPLARVDDVVVLDPSSSDFPVGLNPLLARGRSPEVVADHVLAVFHGLYAHNWGPRMQDILHAALLTLARRGDTSLCVLPALLTNPSVRRRLRAGLDDPIALEPFWAWFESISEPERLQAIAPVINKLRPFLLRKSARTIVGQLEPRFRLDEVFSRRRVVLVSLAKGLIGPEAAALLGSLFVAELWQAILGRARLPGERRQTVSVYADEFQDYVHLPTDMADALAQARGLGVGLTLAHQHLAQLPGNLRASVLANARSRVCFQLGGEDAQVMARLAGEPLRPIDFQRLRRYQAYVQLVVDGEVTPFASARTLPLPTATTDPDALREASRRRYGRPVDEVEAEIRALVEPEPEADALGRRRRQP